MFDMYAECYAPNYSGSLAARPHIKYWCSMLEGSATIASSSMTRGALRMRVSDVSGSHLAYVRRSHRQQDGWRRR